MATIQFLAGNPKKGSAPKKKSVKKVAKKVAKKASKKAPSAAQLKARANFVKMVRAKSKAAHKAAPKKVSKKASKKGGKKKNPQQYTYQMIGGAKGKPSLSEFKGMEFPTRHEIAESLRNKQELIRAKKNASPAAQKQLTDEIIRLSKITAKQKEQLKSGMAERKALLSEGAMDILHDETSPKYADRSASDKKKKSAWKKSEVERSKVNKAAKAAKVAEIKAKQVLKDEKAKKAKIAQQTKQGVFKVAKKKSASKKVSKKKATKKRSKKAKKTIVVAKKPSRKKASKKASKKGGKKSNPRSKSRKVFSIKKRSNPSISSVTGQSDNMAVAGLAIGGFSYNLFNDLGKRYLPSKVMEYIAMAGPVSGAIIPSAVAGLVLWASSKYPQNKALKHASGIAKGVIASAVVIAGASVYQVVAQAPVKKFIGLSGDESMYGEEMYGQSDIEFSGQADSEFSGQAMSEFSGDEDEFGEDEF